MSKNSFGRLTESTYVILLATLSPVHGYGIMQRVKELSNEQIVVGPGTLYGVLKKMIAENMIFMKEIESQKIYEITDEGKKILNDEVIRLKLLINMAEELSLRKKEK